MNRPKRRFFMRLRLIGTSLTAIGYPAADGCAMVQFNDREHPHGHGWTLYPRSAFTRRR